VTGLNNRWDMSFLSDGLRLNPDGSAPADNPFVNQPGDDRIYTFGHRNPQGITFRPGTGQPYSVEHGPDRNDEVNRLVVGGTAAGTRTQAATTTSRTP
jgi:glucose/arabinose dehydrogenase